MADQSIFRALPYHFRSYGNKVGTIYNILAAPSIEIVHLKFNSHTKIKARIGDEVIETSTNNYYNYPIIGELLDGRRENMLLGEVIIRAKCLEFVFYDKTQGTSKTGNRPTGRIGIDACSGLSLKLLSKEFAGEPERRLFCEYIDNVFLDISSVEIIEYDCVRGVCGGMFYPEAKLEAFEHLTHRG